MELLIPKATDVLLRDLVQERTGMLFDNEKNSLLLEKLAPLVIDRGFQSFLDYYYLLKYDDKAENDWRNVIDAITVQETFFWREMDHVRALVDILVPQWAARRNGEPLRIWSAACATGEEPLTIAIALKEAGYLDRLPVEITATDASAQAIEKVKRGLFRERAFRNLPLSLRARYFEKEGNAWRVDPAIKSSIHWEVANLVNRSEIFDYAKTPFIFCRNVFIYFSPDMIRRVVRTFADFMNDQGYLFVGVSESLLKVSNDFELLNVGDAFVYKLSSARQATFNQSKPNTAVMKGYE